MKIAGFSILFLAMTVTSLTAQSFHQFLREGDKDYDKERYKNAEKSYRDAADLKYGDPTAAYNLGNALYQQGNWGDAATRFDQAARTAPNSTFKADALHNLGNARLKQGQYKEAIEAYEHSLRLRPGDAASKQNLQMAKKKLKREEENKKQQQKEEQQPDQQSSEQQEQQAQPDQQQGQELQQQNQSNQQQNQGEKQEKQPAPDNQQQMKKEDTRRLLETAIGPEDQRNARKYRERRQKPTASEKGKDW